MRGPDGVAAAIAAHLVTRLPGEVDRLAGELGVVTTDPLNPDVPDLDAMPRIVATAPIPTGDVGIADWPFVVVLVRRMRKQLRVDVAATGAVVYEREYPVRVFGWARGDGYHITRAVRDRLVLALVETMLRWQSFGTDGEMRVREDTLTEEYSDVGVDEDLGATVAAGYLEVVVVATETLTPAVAPVGVVDVATPDTQHLPPHPALD